MHIHCRNSAQRQGTFEKQGLNESKLILSHRSLLRGEVLLKGVRGWQCLFQPPFLKISSHKPVFSIFDTQTWSYGRERTTDWSPSRLPKWRVCLLVRGPMETQSAADLRNLLAPGTENREVNIDAQTVIMFLSFYLMCFFPLKQPLSHCRSAFLL